MTENRRYFKPRVMEVALRDAMVSSRVVALVGPRQSGKTTLVSEIAMDCDMEYLSLEYPVYKDLADKNLIDVLRGADRWVIDEIQLLPDMISAIKRIVDEDQRAGKFLITGSIHPFRSGIAPDSLAGRVQTLELLPFSQVETDDHSKDPVAFFKQAFAGCFFYSSAHIHKNGSSPGVLERILEGGYPAAFMTTLLPVRQRWLRDYVQSLMGDQIRRFQNLEILDKLPKLLQRLAQMQGQLLHPVALAKTLGVRVNRVHDWLALLECVFLVHRLSPWHRKQESRMTKAHKLHFVDMGLLAALKNVHLELLKKDHKILGGLLEGFVFSELYKFCRFVYGRVQLYHYRISDDVEVDFVLEKDDRSVVGIEVKAANTVKADDFKGLRHLRDVVGEEFVCGVVLYLGDEMVVMESGHHGLYALPCDSLWSLSSLSMAEQFDAL